MTNPQPTEQSPPEKTAGGGRSEPPRVALLLAPDAAGLRPVFGIPAAGRLVMMLNQLGLPVQVVGRPATLATVLEDLPGAGKRHLPSASEVLVLRADTVIDRHSLTSFLAAPLSHPRCLEGEDAAVCLLPTAQLSALLPDLMAGISPPAWVRRVQADGGLPCRRAAGPTGERQAEECLLAALIAQTAGEDGFLARHLDRRFSRFLSRRLARTAVTPNTITLAGMSLGLLGAALLAMGGYAAQLAGALLFLLCVVVDGVDGEVARLKLQESTFGHYLDLVTDNIVHVAVFLGMAAGFWRSTGDHLYLAALGFMLGGLAVCGLVVYLRILRRPPEELAQSSRAFHLLALMTNRDFAYLVAATAIIGKLDWFFLAAAFGSYLFAAALWVASRRQTTSTALRFAMNLLIIHPTHFRSRTDRRLHKSRRRQSIPLTLPYLAALTPPEWRVTLVDEQVQEIDFEAAADLVAITTWTINSLHAYEIADRFRRRGIKVIMGGPHTSFYAEEAAAHCDAVGIGEGETIWPRMLADAAAGRLQTFYRADEPHHLRGLPLPRYELLGERRRRPFTTYSVQSSRGCPMSCEFCSERFLLGQSYRYRPAAEIVEEIRAGGGRDVLFADSNFAGQPGHTRELLEALIPLKIRWSTLWTAALCADTELLDLAKRSGLLHLNIGFESIDGETLAGMNKKGNPIRRHKEILGNLRRRGISYSLNFIFGWDTEKPDVFPATLAFLRQHRVPAAYFNILTPHKGTPLFERMLAEERIHDMEGIGRWPGLTCHIQPAYCSAEELESQVKELYRAFYSWPSMLARLSFPATLGNVASWMLNLSQRRLVRGDAENFDRY